jgi:hypothetical protein
MRFAVGDTVIISRPGMLLNQGAIGEITYISEPGNHYCCVQFTYHQDISKIGRHGSFQEYKLDLYTDMCTNRSALFLLKK